MPSPIFRDLSKPFGTVKRDILLHKVDNLDIIKKCLNLTKSYLQRIQQRTKIRTTYSDCRDIDCGVPQGAVLGPILFILYINGTGKGIKNGAVNCYADDAARMLSGKSWGTVRNNAENFLKKLFWLRSPIISLHMLLHSFLFRQLPPVLDLKLMQILFHYFDPLSSWSSSWSSPGDISYHHLFCYSLLWKSFYISSRRKLGLKKV